MLVDLFISAQGEKLSCLCGMLATEADLLTAVARSTVNQFFAALQDWVMRRAKLRAVATPGRLAPATVAPTADLPAGRGIAPQPSPRPQGQPGSGQGVDGERSVAFLFWTWLSI